MVLFFEKSKLFSAFAEHNQQRGFALESMQTRAGKVVPNGTSKAHKRLHALLSSKEKICVLLVSSLSEKFLACESIDRMREDDVGTIISTASLKMHHKHQRNLDDYWSRRLGTWHYDTLAACHRPPPTLHVRDKKNSAKEKLSLFFLFSVRCFHFTFMSIENFFFFSSHTPTRGERKTKQKLCLINFKLTIPFVLWCLFHFFLISILSLELLYFIFLFFLVKNNFPLTARKTTFSSHPCFLIAASSLSFCHRRASVSQAKAVYTLLERLFWIMQRRCFRMLFMARKRFSYLSLQKSISDEIHR